MITKWPFSYLLNRSRDSARRRYQRSIKFIANVFRVSIILQQNIDTHEWNVNKSHPLYARVIGFKWLCQVHNGDNEEVDGLKYEIFVTATCFIGCVKRCLRVFWKGQRLRVLETYSKVLNIYRFGSLKFR